MNYIMLQYNLITIQDFGNNVILIFGMQSAIYDLCR